MMKKWTCLLVVLIKLIILTACGGTEAMEDDTDVDSIAFVADGGIMRGGAAVGVIGDDKPISRGLVAKMLALTFSEPADIDHAIRLISFVDTTPAGWYDRYINMAVSLGFLSGGGQFFRPDDPLTLEQAQLILDRLDPAATIRIQLNDDNRHMAISYALWVNLFLQALDNISGTRAAADYFQIVREQVTVLITPQFNPALPIGHVITSEGHFTAAGLCFEDFLNHEIEILRRGHEIMAILSVTDATPTLRNVYIVDTRADSITIFIGGAERTFMGNTNLADRLSGRIANIRINGCCVEEVQVFDETVSGIVNQVTDEMIEIEGIGRLPLHTDFRVYSVLGQHVALGGSELLTIGYDVAEFTLSDGAVAAAVVLRRPSPRDIRVVLSTTGFAGRVHQYVELRSASGFAVLSESDAQFIAPNEIWRINADNDALLIGERIRIVPEDGGKIEILSIGRSHPDGAAPQYRGFLEIVRRADGFVIVNQLPLEEYLFAVIPSEMPESFGLEAAKVQAVTARSYAYNQFFANRFYMYGANVDDSVMSQVYNNFPETQTAIAAVNATRGMFLTYAGSVISANFFSTSAGHTANSADVWINGTTLEFDAFQPPYLVAGRQYISGDFGDLSQEANAHAFFARNDIDSYCDNSPWFRWQVDLTHDELTNIIAANLPSLAIAHPHMFQMPGSTGFPPPFVSSIGDFYSMEVISRGQGGNIREMLITGHAGAVLVRTEYAIRRLLTPRTTAGITLYRHNAPPVVNHFILPSTFFTFDDNGGTVRFTGGGFGHGVGMSQHGVLGMVQRGYDFEGVLMHFYPGAALLTLTN